MLVPMLTPPPGRRLPVPTALLAVAASLSEASAAVREGADLVDLVDLGGIVRPAVAEFRARHPGVLVCAPGEAADLVRHPAVALASGALLICGDPGSALASGLPADRVIVEVMPDGVPATAEAGWAAMVDVDRAAELAAAAQPALAGIIAIAALSSWLGAAVVRTRHPRQVRRALDMAASIRGTRPPARTVRGLA
jgi:dihydropteroate synthase